MKNKKPKPGQKGLPGWMASYADMFTVLMAFFVLLFSMSVVDEVLFDQFIQSFNRARADDFTIIGAGGEFITQQGQGPMPAQTPPPPAGEGGEDSEGALGGVDAEGDAVSDLMNTFMTYMAENIPQLPDGADLINVVEGNGFIQIEIPEPVGMQFNSGEARLLPSAINVINDLAPILVSFAEQGHTIVVTGHTDNIPMRSAIIPSNWSLSVMRASAVVEYLVYEWGLPDYMIMPTGRGEHDPIADNGTPEGRALNRRVEITVFEVTGDLSIPGAVVNMNQWTIPR